MSILKVLIVEDDRINRRILAKLLKDGFGLEILEAADGADGWDAIQRQSPDIVFLDLYLPSMNGVEILDAIRKDPRFKTLPVIIFSSVSDKEIIAKLLAKGVSDYLLKPFNTALLNQRMVKLIEQIKNTTPETEKDNTREKFLIVDPEIRFRTFLVSLLHEEYEVFDVDSGLTAFKLFVQQNPAFIIVGEHISGLEAKELARKLKEYSPDRNPKIILSSEKAESITGHENLFSGVITRSYDAQKVSDEIKNIIAAKEKN